MKSWLKSLMIVASAFLAMYCAPSITSADTIVSGTVSDSSNAPVDQAWLKITDTIEGSTYNTRLTNGVFSESLKEGSYKLSAYWSDGSDDMVVLDRAFTVTGSVYSPTPISASASNKNVSGTLLGTSGNALDGVFLYFHKDDTQEENIRSSVRNGEFSLFLTDGHYTIDGFWDPVTSVYKSLIGVANSTFTIENNVTDTLFIQVPLDNVSGSLNQLNSDGTFTPMNNMILNLHRMDAQGSWTAGYSATVTDGNFSLILEDGNYQVDGAWDAFNNEFIPLYNISNSTFSVANQVSSPSLIALTIPLKNVSGVLQGDDNAPIGGVWLNLHSVSNHNQMGYSLLVSNSGTFSTSLPDGSYQIEGYWDPVEERYHSQRKAFSITNGSLDSGTNVTNGSLLITMHSSNVNGVLQFAGGVTEVDGGMNVRRIDSSNEGFYVGINNNAFQTYLPEGSYQVDGFWNDEDHQYMSLKATFTVSVTGAVLPNPLVVVVPAKNIVGTIAHEANGSPVIHDQWLYVQRMDKNENSSYSAYVKNGAFSLALDNGTYRIYGLSNSNSNIDVFHNFTVSNGQLTSPLEIIIKTANVHGTLKKSDHTPITQAGLFINSKDHNEHYHTQVKDGVFDIYLPDGQYDVYAYWDQVLQEQIQVKASITVANGGADRSSIDIVVAEKNITGTITNSNDVALDSGWLYLYQTNFSGPGSNYGYSVKVKDGSFSLYLPDGHYRVNDFNQQSGTINKNISLNYEFEVANGLSSPDPLVVVILPSNIHGTLRNANHGNITGNLNFNGQNGGMNTSVNVQDGLFDLYLPDGIYEINGFWDTISQSYNQLDGTFQVSNGALVGTLHIIVPDKNVFGTLTKSDGASLTDVSIQLQSVGMSMDRGYSTDVKNGVFSMYLPNGTYRITGYYNHSTRLTRHLSQSFTVTNGVSNPISIDLVIYPSNVAGTLKHADSTSITGNLNIQLQNENYGLSIGVVDGAFDLLLANGTYYVNGFLDNEKQSYTQLSETFVVSNGALVGQLNIVVPANNIAGTLRRADGTIPSNNLTINLQSVGSNNNRGYSVEAKNGIFSMYLPDGSYEVTGYYNQSTRLSKTLLKSFTVTNDVSNPTLIDLVIYPSNVAGTMKNEDGSNITADLNMQLQNGNVGFSVSVVNGSFDLYLANGAYRVNGYWDSVSESYTQLEKTFTVSDGVLVGQLNIVVPTKNIAGTLKRADGSIPSNNMSINLHTVGANEFISYTLDVRKGIFSVYLPDGSYQVTGYNDQSTGEMKPLLKSFTVTNGSSNLTTVNVVIPTSNVTGTLKYTDQSNITGSLSVQVLNGEFGFGVSVVNGVFDLYLDNGTYQLLDVYTDNSNTLLSGTFTVSNGALDGLLDIIVPVRNIHGTLALADGSTLSKGSVYLQSSGGNGYSAQVINGVFSIYVPDGSYHVTHFYNNRTGLSKPLIQSFTVTNGVSNPEFINLINNPSNVSGTLKNADNSNITGELILQMQGANFGFQANVVNGVFDVYLPDGDYQINGIYANDSYTDKSVTFTVSNGALVEPLTIVFP